MPRRLRKDYPGAWHHVMDRGVARRTLFETGRDVRYFLSCLARQVRSGDLEVHAFTVLTTHFHLLVRSPKGRLSAAMQRGLDAYARWFNRGRRRDGPLFRGRFTNRLIEDEDYLVNVIRYIDRNPMEAGLATRPEDHSYGSARHYLGRPGPPWLNREEILRRLRGLDGDPDPRIAYRVAFGEGFDGARLAWIIDRRLAEDRGTEVRRRGLLESAPPAVLERMRRKAILADGRGLCGLLQDPETVREAVAAAIGPPSEAHVPMGREYPLRETLECGALRLLSGLRHEEIAERLGMATTGVRRRLVVHQRRIDKDGEYARAFGELLDLALLGKTRQAAV